MIGGGLLAWWLSSNPGTTSLEVWVVFAVCTLAIEMRGARS